MGQGRRMVEIAVGMLRTGQAGGNGTAQNQANNDLTG